MRRFRLIGVALLAVFALGVATASSAQAESAPYFTVGGQRLAAGKTHNADARAVAPFILTDALATSKIECTGLGTEDGVLLGSEPGNPGRADHVSVLSGCTLTGNGSSCHLAEVEGGASTTTVIKTNPLKSEQVENVVGTHVGSKLLTVLSPASKGAGFVKLDFGGTCTLKSTVVSGSVVGESRLDLFSQGNVELGQFPQERPSWLAKFPASPITSVWLVSNSKGKIDETGQTAFNEESIQTGTALVLLAGPKFEPEPTAVWSPLP